MTDGYKIKRGLIRVNGVEKQFYPAGLQLELKLDFSVDTTYGDYTYQNNSGQGLYIDNANGWVTNGGSGTGNGQVYKTVNAHKVWTRVLCNFNNTSISGSRGGGITLGTSGSNNYGGYANVNGGSKQIAVIIADAMTNTVNAGITLGTDFYLDLKFDNGNYVVTIYDTAMNVLATTSYTHSTVTLPYVGFSMWNYASTPAFCRVKKYREAYEV